MIQVNLLTKQKESHRLREWCQGDRWWEQIVRAFRMDVYTLLYLKWINREVAGSKAFKSLVSWSLYSD